jgi:quercetin dioxygenase-like cupin family protein
LQRSDQEIHNPRTGQHMRFRQTPEETDGALLRVESVNPPTGVAEPEHVHPHQESRAEVITGSLRFVVEGEERRLGPGDAITIPAGTPHSSSTMERLTRSRFRSSVRRFAPPTSSRSCSTWPSGESSTTAACRRC